MIGPGSLGPGVINAALVDPTQVVIWNPAVGVGPTTNPSFIQPGTGAALQLRNADGLPGVILETGANRAVVIGNPQGSDISASDVRLGQGGNGLEVASAGWLFRVSGSTRVQGSSTEVQFRNATGINLYNGNGTDVRWTRIVGTDRGDAATPADGASANSPQYGLRIYNDPVGAPALESFDFTIGYNVLAGGGTADVDTTVDFSVRGVAGARIYHDEGVGKCSFVLPAWDISVDGTPANMPDGSVIYDTTGAAGNRFMGKHAGAFVALG